MGSRKKDLRIKMKYHGVRSRGVGFHANYRHFQIILCIACENAAIVNSFHMQRLNLHNTHWRMIFSNDPV